MFIKLSTQKQIPYPVGVDMKTTIYIVERMTKEISSLYPKQDLNFFIRGSSGAIIAGLISASLRNNINILYIKKENEKSHNFHSLLSVYNSLGKNIILDDFSVTGTTVNKIYEKIVNDLGEINIDLLCVSGFINTANLSFKYDNLIAARKSKEIKQ